VGLVVGLVALLAALGGVAWWAARRGGDPRGYTEGVAAYRAGQRDVARARFTDAVRDEPSHAASRVFLARLAREDGDLTRATSELTRAIELDTTSALAFREMGQLQLQANRPDLAARFLERALRRDQTDRVALGWMGCAMARQGQGELAERFFQRAGQGDWSPCRPAVYGPPGAVAGPGCRGLRAAPGGYAPPGGYAAPPATRP
jgi:predicted Zn-dependent protease